MTDMKRFVSGRGRGRECSARESLQKSANQSGGFYVREAAEGDGSGVSA